MSRYCWWIVIQVWYWSHDVRIEQHEGEDCFNTNCYWTRTFSGRFMDQTLVSFVVNRLVTLLVCLSILLYCTYVQYVIHILLYLVAFLFLTWLNCLNIRAFSQFPCCTSASMFTDVRCSKSIYRFCEYNLTLSEAQHKFSKHMAQTRLCTTLRNVYTAGAVFTPLKWSSKLKGDIFLLCVFRLFSPMRDFSKMQKVY